jgi:hypothetical protein
MIKRITEKPKLCSNKRFDKIMFVLFANEQLHYIDRTNETNNNYHFLRFIKIKELSECNYQDFHKYAIIVTFIEENFQYVYAHDNDIYIVSHYDNIENVYYIGELLYDLINKYECEIMKCILIYILKQKYDMNEFIKSIDYDKISMNAFKKDKKIFKYLINPSDKLCMLAINNFINVVKYHEVSEKIRIESIKHFYTASDYISHITKNMEIELIKKNIFYIKYVTTYDLQLFYTMTQYLEFHVMENDKYIEEFIDLFCIFMNKNINFTFINQSNIRENNYHDIQIILTNNNINDVIGNEIYDEIYDDNHSNNKNKSDKSDNDSDDDNDNDNDNKWTKNQICIGYFILHLIYNLELNETICFNLLKINPLFLYFIKNKTYDMSMYAVKQNGQLIKYVNINEQTVELCFEALKTCNYILPFVNANIQNDELCLECVKKNGKMLKYVLNQTEEMCIEAVRNNGNALKYVKQKTYDICLEAVNQDGNAIQYVTEEYQTEELCIEAVRNDPYALSYIDKHRQTYDVCMEAIKIDGSIIEFVNSEYHTDELCLESIKQSMHGKGLKYIEKQTIDMCWEAIYADPWSIRYVKLNNIDEDEYDQMCVYVIKHYDSMLEYIENPMLDICKIAIENNPYSLVHIYDQTIDMIDILMKKDLTHKILICINSIDNMDYLLNEYFIQC